MPPRPRALPQEAPQRRRRQGTLAARPVCHPSNKDSSLPFTTVSFYRLTTHAFSSAHCCLHHPPATLQTLISALSAEGDSRELPEYERREEIVSALATVVVEGRPGDAEDVVAAKGIEAVAAALQKFPQRALLQARAEIRRVTTPARRVYSARSSAFTPAT